MDTFNEESRKQENKTPLKVLYPKGKKQALILFGSLAIAIILLLFYVL